MSGFDVSYGAAALGGLISFLSPCVLPLVPAYLCYIAGASLEELSAEGDVGRATARRAVVMAVAFVLGFSTVFVALGASAAAISRLLIEHLDIAAKIAGVVIIIFGLHYMGFFRLAFLDREARFSPDTGGRGIVGAYIVGLAFAFGWTPCIGPILGAILTVAASKETLVEGVALLAVYSAGLGIPFLISAYGVRRIMAFTGGIRPHMGKIEIAAGGLLVLTGVAIFAGSLQTFSFYLLETFPWLAELG